MSRKCFTIYVSVYNTHPLLELKLVGKSADYTRGKTQGKTVWSNKILCDNLSSTIKQSEITHGKLEFTYSKFNRLNI